MGVDPSLVAKADQELAQYSTILDAFIEGMKGIRQTPGYSQTECVATSVGLFDKVGSRMSPTRLFILLSVALYRLAEEKVT